MLSMPIDQICNALFTACFTVSTSVDNTTGEGDWRYFGQVAKLSLAKQKVRDALDMFITGVLTLQPNEDDGQWSHIQDNCRQVNDPSLSDLNVLAGVLLGFEQLDEGAHNTDEWGDLKGFSQYLAAVAALPATSPQPTDTIFSLDAATVALMAYTDYVAAEAAGGDQTGSGDWAAFQLCAQAALNQTTADAALTTFISNVCALQPNEDEGQWGIVIAACQGASAPSTTTRQKYNAVTISYTALAEGAHNLDQWGSLKGYAFAARQLHFNTYAPDNRNIEMNDVETAFAQLSTTYSRVYYSIDQGPVSLLADATSHFKGISAYGGKLIFTHTDVGSDGGVGKRIVGYEPIFCQDINTDNPQNTAPQNLQHPCSSQASGRYMAMGIQTSESDTSNSQIQIQDLNAIPLGGLIADIGSIPWPGGINGVGLTKEQGPDGRYILAGIQGNTIRLYVSAGPNMVDPDGQLTAFTQIYQTEAFPESGTGLALITQTDGAIYLVTIDGEPGEYNHVTLYKVLRDGQGNVNGFSDSLQRIDLSHFYDSSEPIGELEAALVWIPLLSILIDIGDKYLETSFRYGKGLEVTSPDSFRVFGSDRNCIPLSQISRGTFIGWTKDWSVCVWDSDPLAN